MKLPSYKRINIVDYPSADQPLVEILAGTLNIAFDNVYQAFNNQITFADNISGTQKTFLVTVDSKGNPISPISFTLNTANNTQPRVAGTQIISAVNQVSSTTYPTSAPFASYQQSGNNIQINNITGLQANQQYSITIQVTH